MCRAVWLKFLFVGAACLCFLQAVVSADGPLVVGFDRFSEHGDIELAVGGRLLLSELSCTACHQNAQADLKAKRGPRLEGAGVRLQEAWLRKYLESPQQAKPGTTMPEVLAGLEEAEKQQAIEALTAFLGSQREAFPEIKATGVVPVPYEFWNTGDVEEGKRLYHQSGCVACHEPATDYETAEAAQTPIDQLLEQLDPEELEEMGLGSALRPVKSVPHGDLAGKYSRRSLTHFLLNPERVRPSGRMPNMKLSPMEAAHVAAYLLKDQPSIGDANSDVDETLVTEGKRLFGELGCANCHTAAGVKSQVKAKALAEISIGSEESCVQRVTKGRPFYSLDELQKRAIGAALKKLPTKMASATLLQQRLLQLNCYGCHERNEKGGVGRNRKAYFETVRHIDIGDEGRLPPQLTGVGSKLTEKWLKAVFEGKGDVRPHVVARMPKFPTALTADLPKLFGAVDRAEQFEQVKVPKKKEEYLAAGRVLLDTGCVECHPVRGESLPGVVGVDLDGVTNRLKYFWFETFLLNPASLKKRTRMPTFFPNGESQNKDLLDGHAKEQIAAMWHYLREAKTQELPAKIERARSQDYELVPSDEPILLRTFMPKAGTHALAVGFKEQVHFAFDTEQLRLTEAWRGRFLDARGTWFERFTPPAVPLGEERIEFPQGAALAVLKDAEQAWPGIDDEGQGYRFEGYRLDDHGVPTMLYRVGGYNVQDRIMPSDEGGLVRQLRIVGDADSQKLWLRGNVGKKLERDDDTTTNENGLTVQVSGNGVIRTSEGMSEWLLPVELDGEMVMEVRYQW